ncbi:probable inactive receptor kinase At5g58300 [Mangifera indica]|uniref:probable inactive receptor kinase At5g58300 n=1 Tax=Mangifera indica TaxID=29780 RepID=UPI001CF998C2|nr:probable inactive receptor kinase At5g58300 [Mangifera indica]
MLSITKRRRSFRYADQSNSGSGSIYEYEDCFVGLTDDLPLVSCGNYCGKTMTLKEVLRSSVGVMGESPLGLTEKVVLLKSQMFAVKRLRMTVVRRNEFGKRVEKLAQVSKKCEYLVPIAAYLYTKRIKFILCEYFPMGSLADLLAGARKYGHTALNWNQRLKIILSIARAIEFIHRQNPNERKIKMNVHGNIKSSNVMIKIDFSACLSDYGFTQLAERVELPRKRQLKPPPHQVPPPSYLIYREELSQKADIYNFGVVIMDILAGSRFSTFKKCILEVKEEITEGRIEFFEFALDTRERMRASQILDIALACTNLSAEGRPSIEQILLFLGDAIIK